MTMTIEDQTRDAVAHRILPDGRLLALYPMIFTWRLCIGPVEVGWYDDAWCYQREHLGAAIGALHEWDGVGDPEGWNRHPRTGRRRPDGDASREHVSP